MLPILAVASTALLVIGILIDTTADSTSSHVVFLVIALVLYVVNNVSVFFLLLGAWTPPYIARYINGKPSSLGWLAVGLLDAYLGLSITLAGALLAVWALEGQQGEGVSLFFPESLASVNDHWTVFMLMLNEAACLDNGGFGRVIIRSAPVLVLTAWHMILSKPLGWLVFGLGLAQLYKSVAAAATRSSPFEINS